MPDGVGHTDVGRHYGTGDGAVLDEMQHAPDLLSYIQVLDRTGRLPGPGLRSLDAIYAACAEQLRADLAGSISYDRRQLAATGS